MNERQCLVLNRMLRDWQSFLTTAKCPTLATCSPDTAQRDIKELVERGALGQNAAGGRSTSYPLPDRIDPRSSTSRRQPKNPEPS